MVVTGPFESYAVADAHDGVINGIRMAGHVKTCRGTEYGSDALKYKSTKFVEANQDRRQELNK